MAIYSLDRGDRETELEFCYFTQDEDGNTVFAPAPISRRGHSRVTVRGVLVEPENAQAFAQAQLEAWIEHMKPIRIKQDGDIITREDIRAEMCRLLKTPVYKGQTWKEYAERGGITDDEIKDIVKHKFGSSGCGGPESISVSREGSGFRLWMSWTKYPSEMDGPTIKGQATLDLAREVLQTEHGLLNPAKPQMCLF